MAANSDVILHHLYTLLTKAFEDGQIDRSIGQEFVPASVDPTTGVRSKDVEIGPEINVSARLYLPGNANPSKKLPLLVYFHGGAFVLESAFSPLFHKHLNLLVEEASIVAVSVEYRLAPEFPLPIAYEDSWLALKWVASQFTTDGHESWIKDYADFNRVFLGGDSAGGNIAHNMAIRIGSEKLDGISLRGVFLNCASFYGKDPIGNEETREGFNKSFLDKHWHFVCPSTTGCDDPLCNPAMDPKLSSFGCKRLLVYVAEKDFFRDRGWYYKETLIRSGWDGEIEVVDVEGEDHDFSVFCPDGDNAQAMLKKVASFINE